jgi:hypothetical protein
VTGRPGAQEQDCCTSALRAATNATWELGHPQSRAVRAPVVFAKAAQPANAPLTAVAIMRLAPVVTAP